MGTLSTEKISLMWIICGFDFYFCMSIIMSRYYLAKKLLRRNKLKSSTLLSGSGFEIWSLICCALLLGNCTLQPDILLL